MKQSMPINCNNTNHVNQQINKISTLCSLTIKQYLRRNFHTWTHTLSLLTHKQAVTQYSAIIFAFPFLK